MPVHNEFRKPMVMSMHSLLSLKSLGVSGFTDLNVNQQTSHYRSVKWRLSLSPFLPCGNESS
jgi:hypothetical protein